MSILTRFICIVNPQPIVNAVAHLQATAIDHGVSEFDPAIQETNVLMEALRNIQDDIPVEWPTYEERTDEPTAKPLADALAKSYAKDLARGSVDGAYAVDAGFMSFEDWQAHWSYVEPWAFEPEPNYFEPALGSPGDEVS